MNGKKKKIGSFKKSMLSSALNGRNIKNTLRTGVWAR